MNGTHIKTNIYVRIYLLFLAGSVDSLFVLYIYKTGFCQNCIRFHPSHFFPSSIVVSSVYGVGYSSATRLIQFKYPWQPLVKSSVRALTLRSTCSPPPHGTRSSPQPPTHTRSQQLSHTSAHRIIIPFRLCVPGFGHRPSRFSISSIYTILASTFYYDYLSSR